MSARPSLDLLRVHTDNYNKPVDINKGTKLKLGSTAKPRNLGNYLRIIEQRATNMHNVPAQELGVLTPPRKNHLN